MELPGDLFLDTACKRLARWRARAMSEYLSTLRRDHLREVRLTLLVSAGEIPDSLVELFIQLVHRINAARSEVEAGTLSKRVYAGPSHITTAPPFPQVRCRVHSRVRLSWVVAVR